MSSAVAVVVAGVVVSGLVAACHTPAAPRFSAPPTTTVGPATTVAPTTTTTAPPDGFSPVTAGSELMEMASALGTVLRIDPRTLSVALIPGTTEPGGAFPEGGQIPLAMRPALVAATNAGFKRADARGGEFVDGRTAVALVPGAATFVIRGDGTFDVGAWQQSVAPAAGDAAVLQNLTLLVDQGQAAPDLGTDILQRWGLSFRPALPVSIWRSGLGIDVRGRLLYAAAPNVVPAQLAQLLRSAGAVRAMELDINHLWVFAAFFAHPDPAHPEAVAPQPLLAGMTPTPAHVLSPGTRDFLAILERVAGP